MARPPVIDQHHVLTRREWWAIYAILAGAITAFCTLLLAFFIYVPWAACFQLVVTAGVNLLALLPKGGAHA